MALQMAGNLEVTPGELQFQVVVGDYSKRQMRLHNKGTKPVAYKIKTTNPKQYFVRPNQGIVQPNERKPIAVMMGKLPEMPTEKCKDKFLVQSIEYEGPIPEDGSDEKFDWRRDVNERMPGAKPHECRLRCVYAQGAESPKSSAPSPAPQPAPAPTSTMTQRKTGGASKPEAPSPAPAPAPAVRAAPAKHSYSMYLIVAILFFLVGRFTHEVAIPGLS